jgi:hypothetical protein
MKAIATACWMGNVGLVHARKVMHAAKDCAINNLAKTRFEPSLKQGIDTTYNEMYRAAMFMIEEATMNSTSPMHNEVIVWKGLVPVASECL